MKYVIRTNMARPLRRCLSKVNLWTQGFVLAIASFLSVFMQVQVAHAAPTLMNREARVTTTEVSTNFDITFEFDTTGGTTAVQGVEFEYCDSPLGTCTTTNTPTIPASPGTPSLSGWTDSTAFAAATREGGDGGGTNNQVFTTRTSSTNETSANKTIQFTGLTNNASANKTYYVRIRLYSDTARTSGNLTWEGVVAQSTASQLTVNARVQERLDFCVGTTSVNDATTSPGADCSAITGNTVDIGIVDASTVSASPVGTSNGGNNVNGIAMVRTNAVNGAVIDYFAEQDTSSGKLKVAGATCSGTATTDQCFNSAGTTQNAIAAGTEEFGMTIAGTNCGSAVGYTCTFASGTHNLKADQQYQGAGTFGSSYSYGTTNGYAWDDSGSTDRIASSAGSSVKVIDDEALILRFAAAAGVTTPTGQYTVTSTYIATATF